MSHIAQGDWMDLNIENIFVDPSPSPYTEPVLKISSHQTSLHRAETPGGHHQLCSLFNQTEKNEKCI